MLIGRLKNVVGLTEFSDKNLTEILFGPTVTKDEVTRGSGKVVVMRRGVTLYSLAVYSISKLPCEKAPPSPIPLYSLPKLSGSKMLTGYRGNSLLSRLCHITFPNVTMISGKDNVTLRTYVVFRCGVLLLLRTLLSQDS